MCVDSLVEEQLAAESMGRVSEEVAQQLVSEVISEEMVAIGDSVYQSDVVDRRHELEQCRKATELLFAGRFLGKWKEAYLSKYIAKRKIRNLLVSI